MELARDLIVNASPWFAALVGGLAIGLGIFLATWVAVKPNKLSHREAMTKMQADHAENMRKIERDLPKLADGRPARVLENRDDR